MSTSFNRQKSNEKQTADSTNIAIEHKKHHRSEHVSSNSKGTFIISYKHSNQTCFSLN